MSGQRKVEDFIVHVPAALKETFDEVYATCDDGRNEEKLNQITGFVTRKLAQYEKTLTEIIASSSYKDITAEHLDEYQRQSLMLLEYVDRKLVEVLSLTTAYQPV